MKNQLSNIIMKNVLTLILLVFIGVNIAAQDSIIKTKELNIFQCKSSIIDKRKDPIVLVNGTIVSSNILEKINVLKIKDLNVLKRDSSTIFKHNSAEGTIIITTKNISDKKLEKLYKLYPYEYSENKGKEFTLTGLILDCEKNPLPGTKIKNLNTKNDCLADFDGKFKIKVRKNDVLQFENSNYVSQKVIIEKQKTITISLKAILLSNDKPILLKKPVIYLYPKEETEVTLQFDFNGKLLTTFPKYEENWKVIASPSGQLYDTKTKRVYNSLFWDGIFNLPKEHYQYKDGFIVAKENLTHFLIEKLEHVGLNNQETNEFIQFWLPILEQNKFNFIHFLTNDACNEVSINSVNPKPETSIRIYMEFYGLEQSMSIKEQQLPKTERKGFTLVEWGGTDVTNKIQKDEL
ncbi:hypothetical protein FIA58_005185 [Flavobacterium jejuense]|uniref:TonB-dependent receptor plug domain-containing protein n=1 Tax=Flavobacterium jejuense TaxID=1544455 RepID=A0ABX0IMN7_9FLAO|nr:hypothetical protein [Flavobacterium jejuense]NHN25067.1 hypothetical protein [Flavobacterium jejuense]